MTIKIKQIVTDEQTGQYFRKIIDLYRRLKDGTHEFKLTMDKLQAIIEGDDKEGTQQSSGLIHGMFTNLQTQLDTVKKWNEKHNLGFTEEDFQKLGEIPKWPNSGKLVIRVVVVYLETLEETMELYWDKIMPWQHESQNSNGIGFDKGHLKCLSGKTKFEKGIQIRTIDLDANRNTRPIDVRDPENSAGVELLACAAHFPQWVIAMNGDDIPYVSIYGLRTKLYATTHNPLQSWSEVPILINNLKGHHPCDVKLSYLGGRYDGELEFSSIKYAGPVFRELDV